jgi:hypothetical protein
MMLLLQKDKDALLLLKNDSKYDENTFKENKMILVEAVKVKS